MKCRMVISFFLVFSVTISFAFAGEWVTSKGASKLGDPFTLKGIMNKPKGQGPFPAVVMLHGASGVEGLAKYLDVWAQRLAEWGYVSLQVGSFSPRGESDISGNPSLITAQERAQDAHDAKSYLTELPFVTSNQIAVMGWSHGWGWTILYAIDDMTSIQNRGEPFQAAIADCTTRLLRTMPLNKYRISWPSMQNRISGYRSSQ